MEGLLCFGSPIAFLKIPFLCWPVRERNFGILSVQKNVFMPPFPPNLESIGQLPPVLLLRGRCLSTLIPSVSHVTRSASLETSSLLFISAVLKFHGDSALWVGFFFSFPSIELDNWKLLFFNSMKFLDFFESYLFPIFSQFLDLYCMIWTSHLLCVLPPPSSFSVSFVLLCFCLFLDFLNYIF